MATWNNRVDNVEPLSEADTKAKLIDPVLHKIGWTEDLIHREETACGIDIVDGKTEKKRERKSRLSFADKG